MWVHHIYQSECDAWFQVVHWYRFVVDTDVDWGLLGGDSRGSQSECGKPTYICIYLPLLLIV